MCGISGIVHSDSVGKNLFNSIRNLEYRGYDSCGMATMFNGNLDLRKNVGGIEEANLKEKFDKMQGCIGIAHTRWATHGGVNRENAHPHLSNNKEFAIVHNGIISNYQEIREKLLTKGVVFEFIVKDIFDAGVFVELICILLICWPEMSDLQLEPLQLLSWTRRLREPRLPSCSRAPWRQRGSEVGSATTWKEPSGSDVILSRSRRLS